MCEVMKANKKDITEKKLMAYNDVFAGIFNSLVFYGTGLVTSYKKL